VYLTLNDQWVATFEVGESVKSDAISSIQAIHQLGMRVELLSGDVNHTVQQFAKQVGITHAKGDCSPQDKLQHLQDLQSAGRKVAMVGDGLNDGPVLALAHTSIAMGHGVPLAQAQSDFIIMNDQVSMVVVLLVQAKRTMRVVKQNLFWAFVYNAVCVPLAIAGLLPAWLAGLGMAVSSLVVVINAMRLSQYSTQFRMGH
jgi:Cu2+-exporting ATPase